MATIKCRRRPVLSQWSEEGREVQNFYLKSLAKDFGRETKDDLCMGIRAPSPLPDGAAQIRKVNKAGEIQLKF